MERLSGVRTLVSQLYESLNVEEHQLKKERDLLAKLEELKVKLEPLEKVWVILNYENNFWANVKIQFTLCKSIYRFLSAPTK